MPEPRSPRSSRPARPVSGTKRSAAPKTSGGRSTTGRSSRGVAPSGGAASNQSSSTRSGTGFGKTSDQGRGAAKRNSESLSGRALRNKEATGSSSGKPSARSISGRPTTGRSFVKSDAPRSGGPRHSTGSASGDRKSATRGTSYEREERVTLMAPARKGWGSVTRKGAAAINERGRESTRELERIEKPRTDRDESRWVAQTHKKQPVRAVAEERIERPRFDISPEAIAEVQKRAGKRAERMLKYLKDAGSAYAAERWTDSKKSLRPLLQEIPDSPVVQELHGMVLYRMGKWAIASKELELAHLTTRSYDLYPAIMDCYRALKKFSKVEELWDELRAESPGAEVTAEGRMVMAGSLADQSRVQDGIRLMEKAPRAKANPKDHHLRSWYVLADLYDKAGESSKARSLFQKVAKHDPELADVLERLDALGSS